MSVLKCCVFQGKVTNELSQVLEDEEKRWLDTLNVEEYQLPLARTVIQVSAGTIYAHLYKIGYCA